MFTGIIEEIGIISSIKKREHSIELSINAEKILHDISIGDSIAVNGICLTVTKFSPVSFTADVMHETVTRTSLNQLRKHSKVNLERSLKINKRFGGHMVTGHIDGTGIIINIKRDSIALWYTIKTTVKIMRYIIEKGSIAIDGISLTVALVSRDSFSVSIIPHTLKNTSLVSKKVNDIVNLENDCIGKYIEKFIFEKKDNSKITREFLSTYGY